MASVNATTEDNVELVQQIERIQNHKNVQGLILVNAEGNPVRSNLDNSTSLQYTRHMEELKTITEHVVRDLDPRDELVVLRIRNKFNEIMVLPGKCRNESSEPVRKIRRVGIRFSPDALKNQLV
ncbi:unnamed protein product [Echinostoma caproni]|uniref:Robl_LC7 domain-containing protein n=1 Tax=Echinostoma caproni TaxID=27848 RepID=A0A183AG74_9TREM|nr:unnamed protein product [Echinostoma caproni]